MVQPTDPLLTPAVRHRLKEKFPELEDADLPLFAISEDELVQRIARCTSKKPESVRRVLSKIGAFVPHRVARRPLRARAPERQEESMGSGVPDDTAQSGAMGMGPGW